MSTIYFGSARHDENGNYVNGSAGDSLQKSTPDYSGEVSMQEFYVHSYGWNVLRAKSVSYANALAERMTAACNNANIGYDQNNRYGIITYGINTTTKTECDCSSLVRECVKEATGTDPGDFTTETEKKILLATGLFDDMGKYTSGMDIRNGDICVTCSKGHTGIICSGNPRVSEGWVQDSTGWWWRNSDGSWPASCWKKIAESSNSKNVHWYYFGSSGYMKTGLQYIGGKYYVLSPDGNLEGACMLTDENGALYIWYV